MTTCRSDYGPGYWLIHELFSSPSLEPLLLVGGAHLSAHHGGTVAEIERDGWPISARVPFLDGDAEPSARALAGALEGFGAAFDRLRPDLVILYGDRVELLPVATAATLSAVPLAHVCGGDVTEGAIDDQVRHALTKLSHVHFPSTSSASDRLLQMGEEPWRVHQVGDPALDHFHRGEVASDAELVQAIGFVADRRTLLVTLHPATLDPGLATALVHETIAAVEAHDGALIITAPAPDPGAEDIRRAMIDLVGRRPRAVFVESLGSRRYRALLAKVGAMVGNSSSGLIEAPAASLPVVNIGRRQAGRDRGRNVIDVSPDATAIARAIEEALSPAFRHSLVGVPNPYGNGDAARAIVQHLAALPDRARLLSKRFVMR